jgi:hypothetical protein
MLHSLREAATIDSEHKGVVLYTLYIIIYILLLLPISLNESSSQQILTNPDLLAICLVLGLIINLRP